MSKPIPQSGGEQGFAEKVTEDVILPSSVSIESVVPSAGSLVNPEISVQDLDGCLLMNWIDEVLTCTGKMSLRRRKLPAGRVVWLIIAQALYRERSLLEVLDSLGNSLVGAGDFVRAQSAITQARNRIGVEPFKMLLKKISEYWSNLSIDQEKWMNFSLWAMDGTTLKTPDSTENREAFGSQVYSSGAISSYPQIRGVNLMNLYSRIITEISLGEYNINENRYAKEIIDRIPDYSITMFDKGFFSVDILEGLRSNGSQRHFVIPAKANTKWEVISGQDFDWIVKMKVSSQAALKNPSLPEYWFARVVNVMLDAERDIVLVTSLMDQALYKNDDIKDLYARRWEAETCYREIKQVLLSGKPTLRSRSPQGIFQEILGAIVAYNFVRLRMVAISAETKYKPTDLSFSKAYHLLQGEMFFYGNNSSKQKYQNFFIHQQERLRTSPNIKRKGRSCPRIIKAPAKKYPVRVLHRRPA